MDNAVAIKATRGRAPVARAGEFRAALEQALEALDADEHRGPALRATGMRMRFDFTDLELALCLAASERPGHHVEWAFEPLEWEPRLRLWMESEVANALLQGRDSIPVAIAQGRVRLRGGSRTALLYLPAIQVLGDPYRRCVRDEHPALAL